MKVKTVRLGEDARCIAVEKTDGTPVLIPLFSQLPRKRVRELNESMQADAEGTLDAFFRGYLGDDVDEMSLAKWNELVQAWTSTSEEDAGATLGE